MSCYFKGCTEKGTTKEHIPPRSFFPEGEREQLLTVKSCKAHNNDKSTNDLYVLAQICMNASPSNRAREVFQERVLPQLSHNNHALRRMLLKDSRQLPGGAYGAMRMLSNGPSFLTLLHQAPWACPDLVDTGVRPALGRMPLGGSTPLIGALRSGAPCVRWACP
jgi:hypothetical protein